MDNIKRLKQLAGILKESVEAVPGLGNVKNEAQVASEATVHQIHNDYDDSIHGHHDSHKPEGEFWTEHKLNHLVKKIGYSKTKSAIQNAYDNDVIDEHKANRLLHILQREYSSVNPHADFSLNETDIDEKAPPGMEDMVMKLKKEYPGHPEKAFATAWSIFNKKHGKTEEGCTMEEDFMFEDNYDPYENFLKEIEKEYEYATDRSNESNYENLRDAYHAVYSDRMSENLRNVRSLVGDYMNEVEEGKSQAELEERFQDLLYYARQGLINEIKNLKNDNMRHIEEDYEHDGDSIDDMMYEIVNHLKSQNNFNVHTLTDMFNSEHDVMKKHAIRKVLKDYFNRDETGTPTIEETSEEDWMTKFKRLSNEPQASEHPKVTVDEIIEDMSHIDLKRAIKSLGMEKFLKYVQDEDGNTVLDGMAAERLLKQVARKSPEQVINTDVFSEYVQKFENEFPHREFEFDASIEEEFNLNNSYGEEECANPYDYFPTGSDGPVTKSVGPSGARQGDNPEQKSMEISETYKKLVYSYRSFIKENKSK